MRSRKPHVIVEIGSLVGCSSSHLALACLRNGSGTVYAVDPHADFSRVREDLLPYIVPVNDGAAPTRIDRLVSKWFAIKLFVFTPC